MKSQMRKIVTFLAINLLGFAVYLNFIHKDNSVTLPVAVQSTKVIKGDSTSLIKVSDNESSHFAVTTTKQLKQN